MDHLVQLGDRVKDSITGFAGTAVSRTEFITGCIRIGVQPDVGKDGKLPEGQGFDEPMLIVTQKAKPKVVAKAAATKETGGPRPLAKQPAIPKSH
jgi:hypothetical protein